MPPSTVTLRLAARIAAFRYEDLPPSLIAHAKLQLLDTLGAMLVASAPKSILQEQDLNQLLFWITDLQAIDWRPPENRGGQDPLRDAIELLRREGVELRIVDVGGRGDAALPNLVVASVGLEDDSDVFAGGGFRVVAWVHNFGARPVDRAISRW